MLQLLPLAVAVAFVLPLLLLPVSGGGRWWQGQLRLLLLVTDKSILLDSVNGRFM